MESPRIGKSIEKARGLVGDDGQALVRRKGYGVVLMIVEIPSSRNMEFLASRGPRLLTYLPLSLPHSLTLVSLNLEHFKFFSFTLSTP